jgi:hypothetical protein
MTVTTEADLTAAAAELERQAPGYLERVRTATTRLAARPGAQGDPRVALEGLAEVTTIDVDVPTMSQRRSVHVLKVAIRRLLGWYLRYVGGQVTVMGQAVNRLGVTLVERTEQLGDDTVVLQRELRSLGQRVSRLEGEAEPRPPQ